MIMAFPCLPGAAGCRGPHRTGSPARARAGQGLTGPFLHAGGRGVKSPTDAAGRHPGHGCGRIGRDQAPWSGLIPTGSRSTCDLACSTMTRVSDVPRDGFGRMRRSRVGSTGPPPTSSGPSPVGPEPPANCLAGRFSSVPMAAPGHAGTSSQTILVGARDVRPQGRVKFVKSGERLWPPPPGPRRTSDPMPNRKHAASGPAHLIRPMATHACGCRGAPRFPTLRRRQATLQYVGDRA
jgi:hypothetical protein